MPSDSAIPPQGPSDLPVVLTPEDIYLFIFGGSSAAWKSYDERSKMSVEELVDYGYRKSRSHLSPEKLPILDAQLADPDSWVSRSFKMMKDQSQNADWDRFLTLPRFRKPLPENKRPRRGDPQVAVDHEVIVQFVREAFEAGRLPEHTGARVLAEAGESLNWIDSIPDLQAITESISPISGSPTERRALMVTAFPVLGDLMAEQNGKMCERLAECAQGLAKELRERLVESRRQGRSGR